MKLPNRFMPTGDDDRAGDAAQDVIALSLVGDGLVSVLWPRRHVMLWKFGPKPYQRLANAVADHPMMIRAVAAAELAGGLWWTRRLYRAHAS